VFITSDIPILASARSTFQQSFNEVNAVPVSQASTTLYFNRYDLKTSGMTLDTIHISNPNASSASVTVSLPGATTQMVTVPARGQSLVTFPGKSGGPVTISSSAPVIASQRVRYNSSFSEVYAVPGTMASTQLMLNWYDTVGFTSDNIHVTNPNATSATVTVTVGSNTTTVTVAAHGVATVSFTHLIGGPVFVSANVPVLASARSFFQSSFNEVNSIPIQ